MKLKNEEKINLIIEDLESWLLNDGDSDGSMRFAFENGYHVHAASLWLSTGALSEDLEGKIEGVKINHNKEMKEIKALCEQAHIYICSTCNHNAFLNEDNGADIVCSSCLGTAKKEVKK